MPTRFIKESCRSSKNLDRVTDFEERLFWRLITTADDFGRFLADPELVRSACFPRRDRLPLQKLIDALAGLQRNHLITLYSVKDRQYGQFCTFEEHQGKPRSRKSKYPAMLDTSLHADASNCVRVLADVTGHPDTDTDTKANTDLNSSSPEKEGSGEKTRLAPGLSGLEVFMVDEELTAWAMKAGIEHPEQYLEEFKDYWRSVGGKRKSGAVKDWPATFRNYLRMLRDNGRLKGAQEKRQTGTCAYRVKKDSFLKPCGEPAELIGGHYLCAEHRSMKHERPHLTAT